MASALAPERAEAFHLCGHIFTTGSCPHPFRPRSRVDRWGYPLHPKYGFPVDDDGEPFISREQVRRSICREVVAERFPATSPARLQGTWSRCCNGRIRTIVDCCSRHDRRINGDRALAGYCRDGRSVFCIVYRDTNVRC